MQLYPRHFVLVASLLCLAGIALLDDINLGGKFLLAAVVIAIDAVIVGAWHSTTPPWNDGPPGRSRHGDGPLVVSPDADLETGGIPREAAKVAYGIPMTGDHAARLLGIAFGALIALEDPARDRAGEAQRILRAGLEEMEVIGQPLSNARVRPV